MITDRTFDHDEDEDFTRDFTASIDQDYITLFIYNKGQDFDKETAGKKASRAIVELFPYTTSPPNLSTGHIKRIAEKYYFQTRVLSVKRTSP